MDLTFLLVLLQDRLLLTFSALSSVTSPLPKVPLHLCCLDMSQYSTENGRSTLFYLGAQELYPGAPEASAKLLSQCTCPQCSL